MQSAMSTVVQHKKKVFPVLSSEKNSWRSLVTLLSWYRSRYKPENSRIFRLQTLLLRGAKAGTALTASSFCPRRVSWIITHVSMFFPRLWKTMLEDGRCPCLSCRCCRRRCAASPLPACPSRPNVSTCSMCWAALLCEYFFIFIIPSLQQHSRGLSDPQSSQERLYRWCGYTEPRSYFSFIFFVSLLNIWVDCGSFLS